MPTYEQSLSTLVDHSERMALLNALVAWRDARRASGRPSRLNDPKQIARLVYAPKGLA